MHFTGANQPRSLDVDLLPGQQQIIVPFHVLKYRLRRGAGDYAKPGTTIACKVDIFSSDGTQITSSKGGNITHFLIGRKRLIQGLQVGLMGAQRNQKMRLVISPDYAYSGDEEIPLIPPQTRLVFQLDVLNCYRVPVEKMTDVQLYYQVYHYLRQAQKKVKKQQLEQALIELRQAYSYAKKIKKAGCSIVGRISLKMGSLLHHLGKIQQAFRMIQGAHNYQKCAQDSLRLHLRLSEGSRTHQDELVGWFYQQHMQDIGVRRLCVQYYKETQQIQKLRGLQGYDYRKDRLLEVVANPLQIIERSLSFKLNLL